MSYRLKNAFLAAGLFLTGSVGFLQQIGAFKRTVSRYETSLSNKPDNGEADQQKNAAYVIGKAKETFAAGDAEGNEHIVLVINGPDNWSNKPAILVQNIYADAKEDLYSKLDRIPNTTYFVYGSGRPEDGLKEDIVDSLIVETGRTKAKDVTLILAGHGTFGSVHIDNTLDLNLSYRTMGYSFQRMAQEAKGGKNVNLLLFPCGSGSFCSQQDPGVFKNISSLKVYGAADGDRKSSPVDALIGLDAIAEEAIARGDLPSMEEMSLTLIEHSMGLPGKYGYPVYEEYTSGVCTMAFMYDERIDRRHLMVDKKRYDAFKDAVEKTLPSAEAENALKRLNVEQDTLLMYNYLQEKITCGNAKEKHVVEKLIVGDKEGVWNNTQKAKYIFSMASDTVFADAPMVIYLYGENSAAFKAILQPQKTEHIRVWKDENVLVKQASLVPSAGK